MRQCSISKFANRISSIEAVCIWHLASCHGKMLTATFKLCILAVLALLRWSFAIQHLIRALLKRLFVSASSNEKLPRHEVGVATGAVDRSFLLRNIRELRKQHIIL